MGKMDAELGLVHETWLLQSRDAKKGKKSTFRDLLVDGRGDGRGACGEPPQTT